MSRKGRAPFPVSTKMPHGLVMALGRVLIGTGWVRCPPLGQSTMAIGLRSSKNMAASMRFLPVEEEQFFEKGKGYLHAGQATY